MRNAVVVSPRTGLDGPRSRLVAPRRHLRVPLPVSDVRCSTRVVVVPRGGVVDVAATLVVLWLFVMRRGNPDRSVNCGKSVLAFWEVQTIWNRRDEICNGALYFGTTYTVRLKTMNTSSNHGLRHKNGPSGHSNPAPARNGNPN